MPALKFFMQMPEQPASTVPYGNNVACGKYADAGDVKLYYETYGKGEPFLVLHGGGAGCAYEMGCFIDRLQKKYRVIIPSTRGHGRSGFGTEPLSYAQKAQDIMAVLKAEKIKKVRILGFSDGAYTAYKIAELFPDVVTHIIAIGAGENIPGLRQVVTRLEAFKQLDAEFVVQQQA
ncbi:MAG: alpha/beta hydrolase, partial [Sutterellaceae bacterium]|nr:alpha/beta hydrolase [Sutterellaceae bacterium]